MQAYIDQATLFIETNQFWAGPIIGLLTFGESMLILGMLIPATTLLLLTGGLIGSGTLDPTPIVLWGFVGAVLGDALSYWIGVWVGPSVLRWGLLKKQRRTVARARLFFYRYGLLAVFFGRFLGPIRSTIPTVAGVMGMTHGRFQVANILSAIAWMPVLLLPGYLAARSLDLASHLGESAIYWVGGFSVIVGLLLIYIFMHKKT
ncbi:DedA family protein [Orrella sp. 11846]|uniref:DedA family protein n=1 Tax=Orrella sp. 11846 TaxID=3409913 RepID=UPI003B5A9B44